MKAPNSEQPRPLISCIISTGLGRLHFVPAAEHIQRLGVDVEVIQGWVPRLVPDLAISVLGGLISSKHLAVGMSKRRMPFLAPEKNHGCAWPEFFTQALLILSRLRFISRGSAALIGWRSFGRASKKYLKAQDCFHVRSGAGQGGAIIKAKALGIKVVTDQSIAHPAFMERALRGEYEKHGLPFWLSTADPFWSSVLADCHDCDLLLVNSDFVKETFVAEGFPENKIAVVYLGVREDFFGIKREYSAGESINLLFTGGFGFRKGAQYLLAALKLLEEAGFEARLDVVGAYGEARSLIDGVDLVTKLTCHGFIPQDDLKDHLAAADIYVFPSLAEGCASSGMEAMAAGLPVIATRESGLPIRHLENGFLIPSKSAESIASAVKVLSADRKLRERLGREAARTISENCSWQKYGQNVLEVYRSLLAQNS